MTQDKTPENDGKIKKAECFRCGGSRNCYIIGEDCEADSDEYTSWSTEWSLLKCRGCDDIFFQKIFKHSEDVEYVEENGEQFIRENENIEYWPARSARKRPEWMHTHPSEFSIQAKSPELYEALNELYVALDNGLLMLAAIGVRTAFDIAALCLNIGSDDGFQEKLNKLVKLQHIDTIQRNQLDLIVKGGNASAHQGWRPGLQELNVMMDILEHFVDHAFVAPSRTAKQSADRDKLAKKIPPRLKKTK